MKTIRLYGHLGKAFGKVHRFDVKTVAEAVRALCANFPEFKRYMLDGSSYYKVLRGREEVERDEDFHIPSQRTASFSIVPVVVGAGGPVGRILLGAAIIGASVLTGGFGGAAIAGIALGQVATGVGLALALGGVSQLLAKTPKNEEGERVQSYVFNGPANTTQQGVAVPVVYGRMIVGSVVVSAGIETQEQ